MTKLNYSYIIYFDNENHKAIDNIINEISMIKNKTALLNTKMTSNVRIVTTKNDCYDGIVTEIKIRLDVQKIKTPVYINKTEIGAGFNIQDKK